jgi:hypothetical protein
MHGDEGKLFDVGDPVVVEPELKCDEEVALELPDPTQPMPFEPLTGAIFSPDRIHRYTLWRKLLEKGKTVLFIGLNPSTADETVNDPTCEREERYSKAWGMAMYLKANIFAHRATDPKVMKKFAKDGGDAVGPENDKYILECAYKSDLIVCAWGNHGTFQNRGQAVVDLLKDHFELTALKITKKGNPNHTLYLKKTLTPVVWHPCGHVANPDPEPELELEEEIAI